MSGTVMQVKTDQGSSSASTPISIGIIGAGPAGLMTALALETYAAASSIKITILDRNASETDYPGVEYGIQERACRALERIGHLETALARGNPATGIDFSNTRLQRRFRSITSNPKYTRSVVRQEFLADLAGLLRHTLVERRHRVTAIQPNTDGSVTAEGQTEPQSQRFSRTFDLLVAADGVNSVARKTLFPTMAEIHDRGFSCIYMLLEGKAGSAPAGFIERANAGQSALIMGSICTMTLFPLGKGRMAYGIGFDHAVKRRLWQDNNITNDTPWTAIPADTKKNIAIQLVSDVSANDEMLIKALDLVPDWNSYKIYLWAIRDTDPLPKPYTGNGNTILIGDAAHAIMPTIGMGASLAIEDAEHLAKRIAAALKAADSAATFRASVHPAVFAPFTADRFPVWKDLIGRARTAATGNFIKVHERRRFSIGPQIPNNGLSRIVTWFESVRDRMGL
jgi:salicylate hydroxylase